MSDIETALSSALPDGAMLTKYAGMIEYMDPDGKRILKRFAGPGGLTQWDLLGMAEYVALCSREAITRSIQ